MNLLCRKSSTSLAACTVLGALVLTQVLVADIAHMKAKHVPGMPVTGGHASFLFRAVRAHANTNENLQVCRSIKRRLEVSVSSEFDSLLLSLIPYCDDFLVKKDIWVTSTTIVPYPDAEKDGSFIDSLNSKLRENAVTLEKFIQPIESVVHDELEWKIEQIKKTPWNRESVSAAFAAHLR